MSRKIEKLAIGLLTLGLLVLMDGCERCSNNSNNREGGKAPTDLTNKNDENGGSHTDQLTSEMLKSTKKGDYTDLKRFLEKMQQGEEVNMEEKLNTYGTPLGTLCTLFVSDFDGQINYDQTRLRVFDFLASKGASLNGAIPSGQTILEYASKRQNNAHLGLTAHVLTYKDKIDPAIVRRAYKDAKAKNRQEIVKLFNDAGINDQNINP
jgi:hypothetical protein